MIRNEEENLEEYLYFYPKLRHEIPLLSAAQKFLKFKQAYQKIIDSLPDRHFDVIHVNTIFPAAIPAIYALKKFPAAALFITEHWSGYYPEDGNYKGSIVTRYTKQLVAKARAIMVISEKLEQAMNAHGLKSTYHLICNTVDTNLFKPQDAVPPNTDTLQILHVSSLTEREKNISGIIAIAAELKKKQFPFHLTLVGENTDESAGHKTLVREQLLEAHVTFTGFRTAEEIADDMNRSDVFLLFSHFEGAPVVITEALACGLPVISTKVGQISQMIPSDMGIILETSSIQECVDALLKYKRSDFRNRKAMNDYICERYSPEAVCRQISGFYQLHS